MNLPDLAKKVREFKKSDQYKEVKTRLKEFNFSKKTHKEWFSELCFCILTANTTADGGMKLQATLGDSVCELSENELSNKLKELQYRFPNVRAKYIHEAKKCLKIKDMIKKMPSKEAREFIVDNIKGLGMKEASHFLRNTGRKDVAIIDRHILRILGYNIDSLTRDQYLEIEREMEKLGKMTKTNLAELDLILWAIQTGKVLK